MVAPSYRSTSVASHAASLALPRPLQECCADWIMHADGTASGPGNATFSLFDDPPKVIRAALRVAWRDQLASRVAHRNGMTHAGVPDPGIADRILRRLQPGMQCHVAQTMVGAFMSGAAKAKWDRLQAPTCDLCGQVDSKTHRLLECPVAANLRALYQPVLEFVVDEMPHWLHCPYPTSCPDEAFLRLFWRSTQTLCRPQALFTCGALCLRLYICSLMDLANIRRYQQQGMLHGPSWPMWAPVTSMWRNL